MMLVTKPYYQIERTILKKFTMHKIILRLFIVCCLFGLMACDDEVSVVNEKISLSTIASGEALHACTRENEGTMVYVTDSATVYYCAAEVWLPLNGNDGEDGKDGINGIDGKNGTDGENGLIDADTSVLQRDESMSRTITLNRYDTVYYSDTLKLADTVIILDTLITIDTLVLTSIDTVIYTDTIMGLNGEGCEAKDTVGAKGLAGLNIDCGGARVGTIWNGKDGKSAYEIAVENGFLGTEKEWLESLRHYAKDNGSYFNSAITYGVMVDYRDNQIYRTVVINDQTWMAENLNYAYNEGGATSYCYDGNANYCAKYGRLYRWSAAMDSAAVFSTAGKGCGYGVFCGVESVRGVCPKGWHLPSFEEYYALFSVTGGPAMKGSSGTNLKSTSGWNSNGNGKDSFGFTILPAGYAHHRTDLNLDQFDYVGKDASFWCSSEDSTDEAPRFWFAYLNAYVSWDAADKRSAMSIRCVKDSI